MRISGALLLLAAMSACQPREREREAPPAGAYQPLAWKVLSAFDLRFKVAAESGSRMHLRFGDPGAPGGFDLMLGPEGVSATDLDGGECRFSADAPLHALAGRTLVFERRPHRWAFTADGRILAEGDHPPPVGAPIGLLSAGGEITLAEVRFQQTPAVLFSDGFMRTAEDPASWDEVEGSWTCSVRSNPLLSANAFYYTGSGTPRGVSLIGEWFWSDVLFQAACRPAQEAVVGLYFCYRGPDDYYLFRWTGAESQRPCRQIVRRRGGKEEVLAEAAGGCAAGQWYTLAALVGSGWVKVTVDGASFFLVRDDGISHGRVGLHVEGTAATAYDDVLVQSRPVSLKTAASALKRGWLTTGGRWMDVAPGAWEGVAVADRIVVDTRDPARLVFASPDWKNGSISVQLPVWERGVLGVVCGYADDLNYYSVTWDKTAAPLLRIVRTLKGKDQVLAERAVAEDGSIHCLEVLREDGVLRVSVDGTPTLEASDFAIAQGRMGLCAAGVSGAAFSQVLCETPPDRKPISDAANAAFAAEPAQMQIWAGASSDWDERTFAEGRATPLRVRWHRADFHGAVRTDLRLADPLPAGAEVGVVFEGDGREMESGIRVCVRATKDGRAFVQADRGKDVIGEGYLDGAFGPGRFSFRRMGGGLALLAEDRAVFYVPRVAVGGGRKMAWYTSGVALDGEAVNLYSDHLVNEAFAEAPADWREGGGVWEVTNKWQCDPRWSFFSGRSDRLAALWYKRPLHGDFSIEYFVGNKMMRERGEQYEYAQDMNVTICADGDDLSSGYSFIFGGRDNTQTALFRKGELWAEAVGARRVLIDRKGLHRRWYHIRIARTGALIQAWVDGMLVVSKQDDDPLPGGHFAIWTYNNGIMIARVRIAAEGIGPRESPDIVRRPTRQEFYTLYDRYAKGEISGY